MHIEGGITMSEDLRARAVRRRKITNLVTVMIIAVVCGLVIGKVGTYLRNYNGGGVNKVEALQAEQTTPMPDNVDRSIPPGVPNETPIGVVNNAIPTVDSVYAACRQWAEANNAGAWTFDSNGCQASLNGQWVSK